MEECECLAAITLGMDDNSLKAKTQFKDWTIADIIAHLHMFNHAADIALEDRELFQEFFTPVCADLNEGKSMLEAQNRWLGNISGGRLLDLWQEGYRKLADKYSCADPKQRISWAGPDMSARSSITARQMETWAHGQAIFDLIGLKRQDGDRLKNIAHMGVATFGWTFKNRNMRVPEPAPFINLIAPSGASWQWNEVQRENSVCGLAVEFCQIVTQTRNHKDTNIAATGKIAQSWVAMAQCFAGTPNDCPAPGTRFCQPAKAV